MRFFTLSALCLLAPISGLFAHITGTYHVHGGDPSNHSSYTGTLVIGQEGDVYTASWTLSDGSSTGTGVRKDDSLAIVFVGVDATGAPISGVQLYEIHDNVLKEGPWVFYQDSSKGFEVAHKKGECH